MNCPNCGADLPEQTEQCPICFTQITGAAGGSVNDALFNNASPVYQPTPKKKVPVLGIAIGVVLAAALAFVLVFFVLGGRYNGTYKFESMSTGGLTFTADDFSSYGYDMSDVGIKVSFGKAEWVGGDELGLGDYGKSKIKFTSDTVTITDSDGTSVTGDFDGSSFVIEVEGVSMTFSK